MNLSQELQEAIDTEVLRCDLPRALLVAIVMTESGGRAEAWKVEPPYRYLVDATTGKPFRPLTKTEIESESAPADFPYLRHISSRDTEWWGQQASWGPMQVMGAVAREYGFSGDFPALCDPDIGVYFGAQHLVRLRDRFLAAHGWEGVVAAYNAGSPRRTPEGHFVNEHYVETVRRHGGLSFA